MVVLTDRQQRILKHCGNGLSTREIAYEEGIEPETVKYHINRLRDKFGVKYKRELVVIAREWRGNHDGSSD